MAINPCCMSLQTGVKVMAIIDIVLNVLSISVVTLAIAAAIALKDTVATETHLTSSQINIGIAASAIILIIGILGLLLAIRLLVAAKNREMRFCKIWLIIYIGIVTISLGTNIVNLGVSTESVNVGNLAMSFIGLLYRLYMMWVVYAFVQELKGESSSTGVPPRLEDGVVYNK